MTNEQCNAFYEPVKALDIWPQEFVRLDALDSVCLDGSFTLAQLETIVAAMKAAEGVESKRGSDERPT